MKKYRSWRKGDFILYENREENKESLINDSVGRKILDSAIQIINSEGYENLTIRKVAKESGCSNSAIYQRFEDKNELARAVAALQAKPFLHIMDETYAKDADILTNLNRITTKLLEQLYTFDVEAIYMQTLYRGELKMEENPFVARMDSYLKIAMVPVSFFRAMFIPAIRNPRWKSFLKSAKIPTAI